ncbi:hypothetical protein VA596_04370 [Amycolatopsis sp., V23-08]|uniref:Uncharacterized protein n=1 Tax=Amycolatopsis heterodermiae TaxID=3110235 RepID=A0ABU5QYN9_9PSEU|nr:hypothetical protein [Amycolatopsis sp., V23-08]MEA5358760.1 hypothetical protein [Amycolatopsis sp., V23-08]
MNDDTKQTEIRLRRLVKLLEDVTTRLEELEEASALTIFIQDGLVQDVTKLLDRLERRQARERENFLKQDVFVNRTDHEEYKPL